MGQGGAVGPSQQNPMVSQQNILANREHLNRTRRNMGLAGGRGGGATQNRFLTARQDLLPVAEDPYNPPGMGVGAPLTGVGDTFRSPLSTYRLPGRRRGGRRGGRRSVGEVPALITQEPDRDFADAPPESITQLLSGAPAGTPGSNLRDPRMRGIDLSSIAQMQWAMNNLDRITAGETGLRPIYTQEPYFRNPRHMSAPVNNPVTGGIMGYGDPSRFGRNTGRPAERGMRGNPWYGTAVGGGRRRGGRRGGRNQVAPWLSQDPVNLGENYGFEDELGHVTGPYAGYDFDPVMEGSGIPMSDYHRRLISARHPLSPLSAGGWAGGGSPYGYIDTYSGGTAPLDIRQLASNARGLPPGGVHGWDPMMSLTNAGEPFGDYTLAEPPGAGSNWETLGGS